MGFGQKFNTAGAGRKGCVTISVQKEGFYLLRIGNQEYGFGGMQYTNVCNPSANVDDLD